MSFGSPGAGGGGGAKDVGNVTGGMNVLSYDEKTRPFNRQDMIDFLWDYDKNLTEKEFSLMRKSMAILGLGMPLGGYCGYALGRNFVKNRAKSLAQIPFAWVPTAVKSAFVFTGCSVPYIMGQQWTVTQILDMDDSESLLAFHTKRLMIVQRSSMMFSKTSAREVTREEQEALAAQGNKTRIGKGGVALGEAQGKGGGAGRPGLDVNLALGQQALTPIAQSGYQDMPKK